MHQRFCAFKPIPFILCCSLWFCLLLVRVLVILRHVIRLMIISHLIFFYCKFAPVCSLTSLENYTELNASSLSAAFDLGGPNTAVDISKLCTVILYEVLSQGALSNSSTITH